MARKLYVRFVDGDEQIIENVPDDAKVTFAKVNPQQQHHFHGDGHCLRIYRTEQNQLAAFTNVRDFRDLDLTVKTRKVTQKSDVRRTVGADGESAEATDAIRFEWEEASL